MPVFLVNIILGSLVGLVKTFWMWIVGASVTVLAFLFSATIRKYTLAIVAIVAILGATWIWGYSSNNNHTIEVTTHACDSFRKHVVTGPETDRTLNIFKRNGLCK